MCENGRHGRQVNYDFRPCSYWANEKPLAEILQNVKGAARRKMIKDYWEAGCIEELDESLLDDTLNGDVRTSLGRIHPSFLGGEYLPDYLPSEVEIARVELKSTTHDVISIRARKENGGELIHYRVVDEYGTEFSLVPETTKQPFSLQELIDVIDGVNDGKGGGLALRYNHFNAESAADRKNYRDFTTVYSDVYDELHDHYEAVYDAWVLAEEV